MSQEVIEGIAALTAVVVLFWVSNWMVSKSESAAWSQYIENQAASGADRGAKAPLTAHLIGAILSLVIQYRQTKRAGKSRNTMACRRSETLRLPGREQDCAWM